jgi:hypothetical protein
MPIFCQALKLPIQHFLKIVSKIRKTSQLAMAGFYNTNYANGAEYNIILI